METYLPLVGLIAWIALSLVVAHFLDQRQHASRPVVVTRPRYVSRTYRRK